MKRTILIGALLGGCALFATAASAEDYGRTYYRDTGYYGAPEEVEVIAPRYYAPRSAIGAPIENVSLSREVRFDDLDLETRAGARILRDRVRTQAHMLCRQLDTMYPASAENDSLWRCEQRAAGDAMAQADAAIGHARGLAYRD